VEVDEVHNARICWNWRASTSSIWTANIAFADQVSAATARINAPMIASGASRRKRMTAPGRDRDVNYIACETANGRDLFARSATIAHGYSTARPAARQ
jgi:hypothetical protein